MNRRLALTAACAALAVFTAACGGAATASPSAAASAAVASAAPSASPVASEAAIASPVPSATTEPSATAVPTATTAPSASTAPAASPSVGIPNQDTNLEALLPSAYQGVKLQKISVKGSQYLSANSDLTKVVSQLGLTAADVSVAIAGSADKNAPTFAAVRFAGADSGKLQQVFQAAIIASGAVVTPVNVGGKDVLETKDKSGEITYFYVRNDVVLGASGKDAATAAAGLALLP